MLIFCMFFFFLLPRFLKNDYKCRLDHDEMISFTLGRRSRRSKKGNQNFEISKTCFSVVLDCWFWKFKNEKQPEREIVIMINCVPWLDLVASISTNPNQIRRGSLKLHQVFDNLTEKDELYQKLHNEKEKSSTMNDA